MDSKPRGAVFIINNKQFMNDHHERSGTEQDCMKLKLLFEKLGFVVCVKEDLKRHVSHLGEFYPPLQAPANNSFRGWYIYIRITIMSLFMCASRDLSYIQLLNPVHNFLLKKKNQKVIFTKVALSIPFHHCRKKSHSFLTAILTCYTVINSWNCNQH